MWEVMKMNFICWPKQCDFFLLIYFELVTNKVHTEKKVLANVPQF